MPKALIAMSGGVDSSVAAYLVKEQGCECIGCTMRLYQNEDADISESHTCCSLDDVEDARAVAYRLGMRHYVFNFTDEFREKVIGKFVDSYERGLTPNPCIDCNRYMKFGTLYERARILGCDYIVTGHYARISYEGEKYVLKKALDETKDQSYFLYVLTQEQLAHTLFPLGEMSKADVRQLALENRFVNAEKTESQDICFVPDGNYANAIERYTGRNPVHGHFVDKNGNVLGQHKGIIHYTVGQRHGLGISFTEPLYVCRICSDDNSIVLGMNEDLYQSEVTASEFHWISDIPSTCGIRCKAKIRYRQPEQWATVISCSGETVTVKFDEPQRAVTPGQAIVLYDNDIVLGGGVIQNNTFRA